VTEQTTPPVAPQNLGRLTRAAAVLQLLAAHPEVAAAPIDWEIDDRDDLWPRIRYGSPEAETAAQTLAAVLGVDVSTCPVKGRTMYTVYGKWLGIEVSLQAFGPELADAEQADAVTA
jgi:hypothetical protein